ncbi:MAG TPA: alpha/beta hydrolase [Thermoanaerobaculia bacterium]
MRTRLPPPIRLLPVAALLFISGCLSLEPYAAIRRQVPPERFVTVGRQLVYVEQVGEGSAVVLLHGFGASSYAWRKVIPELARSFHVVALDLSGFGYTERPRTPESYTRAGQEALILGVLDALGIARAQLVGHSYGGGLALYLAARHPERVTSLVLIDSSAPTFANDRRSRFGSLRPVAALGLRLLLRPAAVQKSLAHAFYDATLATPELASEYRRRLAIEGVGDAYRGLTVPVRDDYVVDLAKIGRPALVVWGAEDRLIRVEDGRTAAAVLGARFEVMEKTGHAPMEERPDELLRLVTPFLREHSEAR